MVAHGIVHQIVEHLTEHQSIELQAHAVVTGVGHLEIVVGVESCRVADEPLQIGVEIDPLHHHLELVVAAVGVGGAEDVGDQPLQALDIEENLADEIEPVFWSQVRPFAEFGRRA